MANKGVLEGKGFNKKNKGAFRVPGESNKPPPPLLSVGQTVTMHPVYCGRYQITPETVLTVLAEMWLGPKDHQTQMVMVTHQDGHITRYLNFRGQWTPLPLDSKKTFSATWLAAVHFVPIPPPT